MAKNIPVGYVDFVLNIERTGDLEPYAVTFGGKVAAGPFTEGNLLEIAEATSDQLASMMSTVERFSGITAYIGNDGPRLVMERSMDTPGTISGQLATQNVALVMTKVTNQGGRYNKGRLFWPSVPENIVDNVGVVGDSPREALDLAFNTWRGDLIAGVLDTNLDELVIFHDESLSGIPPTPFLYFRCERLVGTQRRRLRK